MNEAEVVRHKFVPNQVYESANYGLLKFSENNRNVNLSHVQKLADSIRVSGQITPILVNENFIIIDGQHRFQACQNLGRPFSFLIKLGADEGDIVEVNTTQRSWDNTDFIDLHAKENEHYAWFKRRKKELGLSVSSLFMLAKGRELRGDELNLFQSGNFKMDHSEIAAFNKLSAKLVDLFALCDGEYRSSLSKPRMIYGIRKLFTSPEYDHKHFVDRLKTKFIQFRAVGTHVEACQQFEKIYNARLGASRKVKLNTGV